MRRIGDNNEGNTDRRTQRRSVPNHSAQPRQSRVDRYYDDAEYRRPRAPQKKKAGPLFVVALIVFLVAVALLAYAIITTYMAQILPQKYFMMLLLISVILICITIILLYVRKGKKGPRIVAIILSAIMIFASFYVAGIMNSANNMVETMEANANVEEAGVVISDTGETIQTEVVYEQVEDVKQNPFLIYLSGLDVSGIKKDGSVGDKGRSDVNIIAAVNPNTKKIQMVTIPRDCYVGINGDTSKMDKLTHCGNWGIYCSMKTIESLFNDQIKLNYYAKVNYVSVMNIVDALGGITVDSPNSFTGAHSYSGNTYHFDKGLNTLNGDQAIAFARERKNLSDGDNQRGRDHEIIIKAIIEKATSPEILTPGTLNSVMDVFAKNVSTSLSADEMRSLIQISLDSPSWDIEMMDVTGKGASKVTYTAHVNRYVFLPDSNSLQEACDALLAVLNS